MLGHEMVAGVELTYNTSASAMQMAQTIFGDGVTVTSASYTGANGSSAIYSNGQLSTGVVPATSGVILSTGNAASFTTTNWSQSNTSTSTSTNTSGVDNNTQFNQVAGATTYDAAWLDVNFIPTGDVMTIQFVFSSEEFPEYSGTIYNDSVGVWINGQVVPLSVGEGDVAVGNINQTENSNLFVSNTGDQYNTEMD
ncbi:MAG: 2,3,4,5-tetrahydropyridine-2,6-carboxylate N-succinyltransferase, partial [Rhodobacteraceae bacterium]|nr:2,3,4,5-tetrahydropyridine-2,6-carboxylate N-succinyltransferase [Paracoccaceae bacterium]